MSVFSFWAHALTSQLTKQLNSRARIITRLLYGSTGSSVEYFTPFISSAQSKELRLMVIRTPAQLRVPDRAIISVTWLSDLQ